MNGGTFLAILALQICLDRHGFSPNTFDGQVGYKTRAALNAYCETKGLPLPEEGSEGEAYLRYFADERNLFSEETVTRADIDSLVTIPEDPAEKAKLSKMGYATLQEMFAERGHLTQHTLARLNTHVDWNDVKPGTRIRIPEVTPSAAGGTAASVEISLSKFSVRALDHSGRTLAMFPCSIARDKSKLPPLGDLKIITKIPDPNYTYASSSPVSGKASRKYIFHPGPNNPVGTVWLGLSLPGYGIHGTPDPERIGGAHSHGCFRLANWNAEKLYRLVVPGTPVRIVP